MSDPRPTAVFTTLLAEDGPPADLQPCEVPSLLRALGEKVASTSRLNANMLRTQTRALRRASSSPPAVPEQDGLARVS